MGLLEALAPLRPWLAALRACVTVPARGGPPGILTARREAGKAG